jgi:hypothetical protein
MKKTTGFVADVDGATRHVEAGAWLLRLIATRLGQDEPGLDAQAPQLFAFIADGMLDRVETLNYAIEQAASSREGAA